MLRLREDDDFMRTYKRGPPEWERQISNFYQRKDEIRMKAKKKVRRIIACFMAVLNKGIYFKKSLATEYKICYHISR